MTDEGKEGRSPGRAAIWILAAALAVDLALLAAHVASARAVDGGSTNYWATHYRLDLTNEESVGETFQHLKTAAVVAALVLAGRATALRAWWVWATVFGWVLIDDAFELHERGGMLLVDVIGSRTVFGLGMQDVGELLVWSVIGLTLAPLFLASLRSDGPEGRRVSWALALPFGVFALTGGGVDLIHAAAAEGGVVRSIAELVEEAGELFAMSAVVATTVALTAPLRTWRPVHAARRLLLGVPRNDPQGP